MIQSERWFIPRHPMLNACMAGTIGDRYGILAWIIGFLLRTIFYRDLWEMAPTSNSNDSIFNSTPIVNSRVFKLMVSRGLQIPTMA